MSWREFWDGDTTIYVSDRHKEIHYRKLARDIIRILPRRATRVLDFGCGEALSAGMVAEACSILLLCDAADAVRKRIQTRIGRCSNILILPPEAVEVMPAASIDVIVVNSVIQYFSHSELSRWLGTWRRIMAPTGRLVIGDIVPRRVGPLVDAAALLKFAATNGFLLAAAQGLMRTFLSDYRRKRAELGLLQFDEHEIIRVVERSGYVAKRFDQNLSHNAARLTVIATPKECRGLQKSRDGNSQFKRVVGRL
jgi:ubiquinone/menaquinone biosynthesis C-methylase UbiE